jgi:hypothetical protein
VPRHDYDALFQMRVKIKKNLFEKYRVGYNCPNCEERLKSPLSEAGNKDTCPCCGTCFVVPGAEELTRITSESQQLAQRKAASAAYTHELKTRRKQEQAATRNLAVQRANEQEEQRREAAEACAVQERTANEKTEQSLQCPACNAENLVGASNCQSCNSLIPEPTTTRKKSSLKKAAIAASIVAALFVGYLWLRNSGLREKLEGCEMYGVVIAKVKYDGLFSTDSVVFGLRDGGSGSARRIDTIHLLLQFARRIDLHSIDRLIVARNGTKVFYISSQDLQPLADSYDGGGRIWSFNHLPERVRTMSGQQRFGEWTGGWLGVLSKQTEDLNKFMSEWHEAAR